MNINFLFLFFYMMCCIVVLTTLHNLTHTVRLLKVAQIQPTITLTLMFCFSQLGPKDPQTNRSFHYQ